MRSATTVVFYGVTTSQRSKQCLGMSGLSFVKQHRQLLL